MAGPTLGTLRIRILSPPSPSNSAPTDTQSQLATISEEEPLDEKPLWEKFGLESLEELGRFHKHEMARRRATRPIPTDEEAEHQHAEHLPKKAERAADPKDAGKINVRYLDDGPGPLMANVSTRPFRIPTARRMMSLEKKRRHPKDWTRATTSTQRQTNNKAAYDEGSCLEQSHWRG
jgi:hypothetical protein